MYTLFNNALKSELFLKIVAMLAIHISTFPLG